MIIMRHGQGQHNVDQVYNSNPQHPNYKPSPLTKMGKEQVQESARKLLADGFTPLNIETIIVSPLQRAQETAEALVEAGLIRRDLIQTDARLGEILMGDREGMPYQDFRDQPWDHTHALDYEGETESQVNDRVTELCSQLIKNHQTGHVLLITHGTPAMEISQTYSNIRVPLTTGGTCVFPLDRIHQAHKGALSTPMEYQVVYTHKDRVEGDFAS
ncbi:MAG: hypothetical protein CMO81_06340 [Waddliaceae bacterium]|nr:hypothetical protein [Waddliaceae bacterium]